MWCIILAVLGTALLFLSAALVGISVRQCYIEYNNGITREYLVSYTARTEGGGFLIGGCTMFFKPGTAFAEIQRAATESVVKKNAQDGQPVVIGPVAILNVSELP